MTAIRDELLARIWRGRDPFAAFPRNVFAIDRQGWGSHHPYLAEAIGGENALVVAEVGVWKGGSTISMALKMQELGVNGVVIAVDTWLGAVDHWVTDEWFDHLGWDHGYPSLQRKFMANVIDAGVQDYVIPLPVDSLNAAEVLKHFDVQLDVLHIDAGHEYASVISDLRSWWPLLKSGGLFVGDDYYEDVHWPGVKQAFHEFLVSYLPFEHVNGKCRMRKIDHRLASDVDADRATQTADALNSLSPR